MAIETNDEFFMGLALKEAEKAYDIGEIPIGAVIVSNGKVIGKGYNRKEIDKDATLHAEMIAIRQACKCIGGWRIPESTMYVTLEPCSMCAGALVQARVNRLVISLKDEKTGACGSVVNIVRNEKFNHKIDVEFGLCSSESYAIIRKFFDELRNRKKGNCDTKITNY